jgi:putative resolvase
MYVFPKEAAKHFQVTTDTLRRWSDSGKLPCITTTGGHRRYALSFNTPGSPTKPVETTLKIVYSRVSSKKQANDLERQSKLLKHKYPNHKVISDIGSGINFSRPGFKRILEGVFKGTIDEVVVAHKDRFTRFGFELFEWIFQRHNAKLLCDQEREGGTETELAEDLLAIVTVFSARYYGKRKYTRKTELL